MPGGPNPSIKKKTYFGLTALITGIVSDLFIGANIGAAYLNITPQVFDQLNRYTALFYCILTQLAVALGVIGFTRRHDSKTLSLIAITLVAIPFLILFTRLVASLLRQ